MLFRSQIQTRDGWVGSANVTTEPCGPPNCKCKLIQSRCATSQSQEFSNFQRKVFRPFPTFLLSHFCIETELSNRWHQNGFGSKSKNKTQFSIQLLILKSYYLLIVHLTSVWNINPSDIKQPLPFKQTHVKKDCSLASVYMVSTLVPMAENTNYNQSKVPGLASP